jgi:hypothetical protein
MADFEVGFQLSDPGRREFFGDEDDRRGHVNPSGWRQRSGLTV